MQWFVSSVGGEFWSADHGDSSLSSSREAWGPVKEGSRLVPAAALAAVIVVAAALVPLHVAPYTEGLSAAGERALERLLARVRVAVDPQRARPREGFVACRADVPVLALGEGRRG